MRLLCWPYGYVAHCRHMLADQLVPAGISVSLPLLRL